ncbi:MAG: iron chaperone [Mediterraneibacter faecis]
MWKCPNCGREFKNAEQNHYCLIKPKTIDEYIALQADEKRADLYLLRKILKDALPEAEERISWSMPTYWKNHNILHFAAAKKHIGLYPGPEAVEKFAEELKSYKTDKGTIRIPYGKVDSNLIKDIAVWCYETGTHA